MIIPNPGSVVEVNVLGSERHIKVKGVSISSDNLYLIKYDDQKSSRGISYINCHYVTRIIYSPKSTPKPLNFFDRDTGSGRYLSYGRKMYSGSLTQTISHCMKKLPYSINVPLDYDKCHKLWEKTKPGYVGSLDFFGNGNGYPIMKKDKIQKWVAVNWSKLLMDKKEWQEKIDIRNKEYSDQYWQEVEEEMDQDFDTFFKSL